MDTIQTARVLGWLSLGIGLIELVSNRTLSRTLGLGNQGALMSACAVREVASGVGLLTANRPAGWLWARLAGDLMDMLILAPAMRQSNPRRNWAIGTLAFVASIAAVDYFAARRAQRLDGHLGGQFDDQMAAEDQPSASVSLH